MAVVLVAAIPDSAPMWQAIMMEAKRNGTQADVKQPPGPPFAQCDAADTAAAFAGHLGWRDMERQA